MNNSNELVTTIKKLEYIKRNSKDYVVPNDGIEAVITDTNKTLHIETTDGIGQFKPSTIAFSQLLQKLHIPKIYHNYLNEVEKNHLLETNINELLSLPKNFLVRTVDNKIRAILSDRFRLIDNYDTAMATLTEMKKLKDLGMNISIEKIALSDTNLYIKIISPDLSAKVHPDIDKPEQGDIVNGGIIISNSDIGMGRFSIKPFMQVLRCSNGLIGEQEFSKVHLGEKLDNGLIQWSETTHSLKSEAFWSEVSDMIQQAFNPEVFKQWVNRINHKAIDKIERPALAIDNVIKTYNINQTFRDELLSEFSKQGYNRWSLSNAITEVAKTNDDYDKQIEMEEIGSKILTAPLARINPKDEE